MAIVVYLFANTLCLAALYFDIKMFKIPNYLCVSGMLSGIIFTLVNSDIKMVTENILWSFGIIALLIPVYCIKILGAGDIKLFAALAAFVGHKILYMVGMSFVCAACYAIVLLIEGNINLKTRTRIHFACCIFNSCMFFSFADLLGYRC